MAEVYFVTTPIYYVNGAPHIGHAYTSIAADVLARFNRLEGKRVYFLTGTDEHGQKVEKAASQAGLMPQVFVDQVAAEFRAVAETLNVSFDDFIRTTEPRHVRACETLWQRLQANGQIYLGSYEGWYSIRDEAFFGEDELERQPDGSQTTSGGAAVEWLSEPSYFFRLSAWQEKLLELYDTCPDFIGPPAKRNEVIAFVRSGLKDLSISRTSFKWGVGVPDDPSHVMYVWFDALANYLSALGWPDGEVSSQSDFSVFWPANLHLVGKEIARFHAVYWPAFLMAAGLALPSRVFSHGWWTAEGEKISKSLGNGIDPRELVAKYGLDAIRFFLLREIPFGRDGDFSERALVSRLNVELANDLGNLAQRSLSLIARNLGGRMPDQGTRLLEDVNIIAACASLPSTVSRLLARQAFSDGLEEVWKVVRMANGYIDRQAPWALRKTDPTRMADVLRVLVDTLRVIGTTLWPFMPETMDKLLDQLGASPNERTFADLDEPLEAGLSLPVPQAIFPRLRTEVR